jgi:hypothetical protein
VPDPSCGTSVFRPDGRSYRAVRDTTLGLGTVAGIAACAGYQPSALWILAALLLLVAGFALVSVKLIVGPDRVSFGIFAMTMDFPAAEIERDRIDELAFMNFFQLSLSDGPFVLIPHAAFADTAAFDTIVALTERQEAKHNGNCQTGKTETP